MANPGMFKSFPPGDAIKPYRLVTHGNKDKVKQATDPEKPIIGATQELGSKNERVDVCVSGRPLADAGGTIAAGDPLTVDSDGKAIKSVPADGKTHHLIGFALEAAADGERVKYEHARSLDKGATASD